MEQIKIKVYVSQSAALTRGSSRYGSTEVPLEDEDVAKLSAVAKAYLTSPSRPLSYDVPVADREHAVQAVEAAARVDAEERAAREAKDEAEIAAALEMPGDWWLRECAYPIDNCGWVMGPRDRDGRSLPQRLLSNARVLARFDALRPELERRREAVKAERAAAKERADAERAAEIELRELRDRQFNAAVRERASRLDDLARAASEEYPVAHAVLDAIASEVVGAVKYAKAAVHHAVHRGEPDGADDRAAPTQENFALLDAVKRAAQQANQAISPDVGAWSVSRIVRLDTCPHAGVNHYVTAVVAHFVAHHPAESYDRHVVFSLDEIDCGHGDES